MNARCRQAMPKASEAGFTLIELLVSMTIMSVILAMLTAGLRVITQNADAYTAFMDRLDMLSRAADIIRRDAAGLQRIVRMDGGNPHLIFVGTPEHLSFVTSEPPYPTNAGPYFVDYSVVLRGGSVELIRARAPYRDRVAAFPGASPANRVPLLQGPFAYRFAYAEKTAEGGTWHDTWSDQTRIPGLIRLKIVPLTKGGQSPIPSIIVGVRSDAELNCLAKKTQLCSAKTGGKLQLSLKPMGDDSSENGSAEDDPSGVPAK